VVWRSPFPPSMVSGAAVGWGTLIAMVAATITAVVGTLVALFMLGVDQGENLLPYLVFFSSLGLWIGFTASFNIARRRNQLSWREALGPARPFWSVLAIPLGVAAQGVVIAITWLIGVEGESAFSAGDLFGWVLIGVVVVVGAPVFEELFFRGVLLPTLAARVGTNPAVAIQAVIFGVVHADQGLFGIVAISVLAVGFGMLRVRAQSVIPCIVAHATFNAVAFAVMVATA
jgi:uncharacterized protein